MRIKDCPGYSTWRAMKYRCLNPNHFAYQRYGGRGITVCERWVDSFQNFLLDMGPRPAGCSIERKDNDGPYSPENCMWATASQQAMNRSNTRLVTLDGRTMTPKQWAREYGIGFTTVKWRLEHGMDLKSALTMPITPIPARTQGLAAILGAMT